MRQFCHGCFRHRWVLDEGGLDLAGRERRARGSRMRSSTPGRGGPNDPRCRPPSPKGTAVTAPMCPCMRVRPRRPPSTGPRTVLTWDIVSSWRPVCSGRSGRSYRYATISGGPGGAECHSRPTAGAAPLSIRTWWDRGIPQPRYSNHMSPVEQPNTPESRERARSRLRSLTRGAVVAATGATVVIGVVVSRDHPGSGSTGKTSGAATSGSSDSNNTTIAGSGSSSSSNTGSTGNTGNTGSSSSSPSISQSTPAVTSGGSSG